MSKIRSSRSLKTNSGADPHSEHRNERALERATLLEELDGNFDEDISILDPDEKTWGDYLSEDARRHDQVYKHFKHLYGVEDDGNIQEWPQPRYKTFKSQRCSS